MPGVFFCPLTLVGEFLRRQDIASKRTVRQHKQCCHTAGDASPFEGNMPAFGRIRHFKGVPPANHRMVSYLCQFS